MSILRMTDLDLRGKRVLIREDLNVPVQGGVVTSDARIRASLPTIQAARRTRAPACCVMSHLGRPEEGVYDEEFSLAPVAQRLSELLGFKVRFEKNWLDGVECDARRSRAARERALQQGREEGQGRAGAQDGGAVRRVRDGRVRHGASRRGEHARRCAVRAGRLRRSAADERADRPRDGARQTQAAARRDRGRLEGLDQAYGARKRCSSKVDKLIVGGGIANTFLAAQGHPIGKSLAKTDMIDIAQGLLAALAKS